MYQAFWNGLFDVRWEDAPLGPEAIRLVLKLRKHGYAERTRRDYGQAVVHLGRFLSETRDNAAAQTLDESIIEDFIQRHLPVCCCYQQRMGRLAATAKRGLLHMLAMLREEGVIPPFVSNRPSYYALLEDYCSFLRKERGLAESTVTNYRRYLRDFFSQPW